MLLSCPSGNPLSFPALDQQSRRRVNLAVLAFDQGSGAGPIARHAVRFSCPNYTYYRSTIDLALTTSWDEFLNAYAQ